MRLADPLLRSILTLLSYLLLAPLFASELDLKLVEKTLAQRCVVCHGCYDAPCQLKMESAEGFQRGATKQRVYEGTRLTPAEPTRLHEDAQTAKEWRQRGFFPVTPDRSGQVSLISRMLALKEIYPLPGTSILPDEFDLQLYRDQACPKPDEFSQFAKDHPNWGMPYALPKLELHEYEALQRWLAEGAPFSPAPPLSVSQLQQQAKWEQFFNGSSNKQRLMARYLYEHLFLANLYFEDQGQQTVFFKLIRSKTPPGEPIERISTRRPFDDPGVERVYYRLWRSPDLIVEKAHMPYRLDAQREQKWQRWFLDADYQVAQLPGYQLKQAANPFVIFEAIPPNNRYRFLLDEAHFTIMNYIKGEVCRGSVALNVIADHFWVMFLAPNTLDPEASAHFLAGQDKHLRLPASSDSDLWAISDWFNYRQAHRAYLKSKAEFIRTQIPQLIDDPISMVWDGERTNANAALTVFRHFDSATVVKGWQGQNPDTVWLIDYPILERIHYLLVAGFDVFGSVSHQAMTRMYMDFLRMESEANFLVFLPEAAREKALDHWYRGARFEVSPYFDDFFENTQSQPLIDFKGDDPKLELMAILKARLEPLYTDSRYDLLRSSGLALSTITALESLNRLKGTPATLMPQSTLINLRDGGMLTLLTHNAYSNLSSMFFEKRRRRPEEDTMTLLNGIVGPYPNVLLDLDTAQLPALVERIKRLNTEEDYARLLSEFGVRRTDPRFWQVSDLIHEKYRTWAPLEAGILDYNRLENR